MSLSKWLNSSDLKKIEALNNPKVMKIVDEFLTLCKPASARVLDDSSQDMEYIREKAVKNGEETALATAGHTIHFDGVNDQGRDKEVTKVLLSQGKTLGKHINTMDRDTGLKEILGYMDGAMAGKEVFISFYCLGPVNSRFSIGALQITDSAYVIHSENLLYRRGYEQFKTMKGSEDFFYFVHSAGELTEKKVSKNMPKKRIYIDLEANRVFSINNQYAGNSVGLKKLALRLGINKAISEGWLCEHMFLMSVYPADKKKKRRTIFAGAFPSACGKTSTAMIPGETIIGDDIAYIRFDNKMQPRAVNIESGIFGIIQDVNAVDDPFIWEVLISPRELIFSNVLTTNGKVYWQGMGKDIAVPEKGINWASSQYGDWSKGMKDADGKEIPFSHANARYCMRLSDLKNVDIALHDPQGVPLEGIVYGGRDSDTNVPVYESFSWNHGVFVGASLESETTAATIGKTGVRNHQPMANLDFVVVPLGKYIQAHMEFGKKMGQQAPRIYSTNYFLKNEQNKFFDEKVDKKIWLLWAEGRIHNEYDAIKTPVGYIPKYEDLKDLFKQVFKKEYTKERYEAEFTIRIQNYLDKMDRIEKIYRDEKDVPSAFFDELTNQRKRLQELKTRMHTDNVSPSKLE